MPVIPVQTRLAPPPPSGNTVPPLGQNLPPPYSATPAAPPLGHWSCQTSALRALEDIGHSAAAPAAIDLRIGSLVLHGFSAAEGRRAGLAFEQELTRLLTESPLPEYSALAALPDSPLDHGRWALDIAPSRAESAGTASARALHARLCA